MIIGLDFDNTIVGYDALFYKVAKERALVTDQVEVNKISVRDHLRKINQEAVWTEMQGYVYGFRLGEANSYPGVRQFFHWAAQSGHIINIISHKTRYPFLGPKYDLHEAARLWIKNNLNDECEIIIHEKNIFFEATKEEKLERINSVGCDVYLDDLPEILLADMFPDKTKRFLFDPDKKYNVHLNSDLQIINSWNDFKNILIA